MKTKANLILTILIIASSCMSWAKTYSSVDQEQIILVRVGEDVPGIPRIPSLTQIECWIEDSEELWLGLQDAGNSVEVTISSNGATNDNVYFLSGDSLSAIPLPETTGVWTITIALENGDVYYGQFVI